MDIKKLKLKNKFFLAPMQEVNDIAFRLLCKKAGASLTWTGLTNPLTKQKLILKDKPALQLFCKDTKGIKSFMKKYDKKVSLWDFNLGCSATNAKKNKFGSYLIDLKKIEEILKEIRKSTKKPFTIKIRKSKISFELLKLAEKYCDAICIHPRTQKQGYSGKPDLKFAEKIKQKSKIPIIYSGNVNEKNAKDLLKKFDYVMIGRAAMGHPEIFAKITDNKKFKRSYKNYLKLAKKFKLSFRQLKFQAMQFTKGDRDSRRLRNEIFKIKDLEGLEEVFN
jgi:tRNA-dihydrouridine synthase